MYKQILPDLKKENSITLQFWYSDVQDLHVCVRLVILVCLHLLNGLYDITEYLEKTQSQTQIVICWGILEKNWALQKFEKQ